MMSSSDTPDATSPSPPETNQEQQQEVSSNNEDDGLWGLTSVLSGSGWGGLGGGPAATDQEASDKVTGASDAELAELESNIAAAETVVSSAIFGAFSAVSDTLSSTLSTTPKDPPTRKDSGALTDEDLDALTGDLGEQEEPTKESSSDAAAAPSSSIWSSLTGGQDPASSLYSLYNSKVNKAAEWINDLQQEETEKDPYKRLKDHLNEYITKTPRGNYKEWIELWIGEEGWDDGSGSIIVDSSFYAKESVHRTLWNERNYEDGIAIDDEEPQRAYVLAPTDEARRKKKTTSKNKKQEEEEEIVFDTGNEATSKSDDPVIVLDSLLDINTDAGGDDELPPSSEPATVLPETQEVEEEAKE